MKTARELLIDSICDISLDTTALPLKQRNDKKRALASLFSPQDDYKQARLSSARKKFFLERVNTPEIYQQLTGKTWTSPVIDEIGRPPSLATLIAVARQNLYLIEVMEEIEKMAYPQAGEKAIQHLGEIQKSDTNFIDFLTHNFGTWVRTKDPNAKFDLIFAKAQEKFKTINAARAADIESKKEELQKIATHAETQKDTLNLKITAQLALVTKRLADLNTTPLTLERRNALLMLTATEVRLKASRKSLQKNYDELDALHKKVAPSSASVGSSAGAAASVTSASSAAAVDSIDADFRCAQNLELRMRDIETDVARSQKFLDACDTLVADLENHRAPTFQQANCLIKVAALSEIQANAAGRFKEEVVRKGIVDESVAQHGLDGHAVYRGIHLGKGDIKRITCGAIRIEQDRTGCVRDCSEASSIKDNDKQLAALKFAETLLQGYKPGSGEIITISGSGCPENQAQAARVYAALLMLTSPDGSDDKMQLDPKCIHVNVPGCDVPSWLGKWRDSWRQKYIEKYITVDSAAVKTDNTALYKARFHREVGAPNPPPEVEQEHVGQEFIVKK